MVDVLGDLAHAIDALCAADLSSVADGESIVALHRQLERLEAVATRAATNFDAGGSWEADGARSAAAWLARRCRLPLPAGQRRVRLGRDLRHMAAVEAAWLAGDIGGAQVSQLAATRTPGPSACFERDQAELVDGNGRVACGHHNRLRHRPDRPSP